MSGDTFSHNTGGIYLENSKSSLSVINSTFLGSSQALEGIKAVAGSVDVTFSTLEYSALSGLPSKFDLSSSLLFSVACNNVKDGLNNLKSSSEPACPGHIPTELGLSLLLLQDNGGPTPTIALVTGSDAIGGIKLGDCVDLSGKTPLTVDQRNAPRPGPANPGSCDTGAFEFGPATTGLIPPGTPTPF